MATGGDIIEVTYNHPTLGSNIFSPKAAEDSTYDLGGFKGNDDANQISGSGKNIKQLNLVKWFFEVLFTWEDGDLERMQELGGDTVDAEWTFTHKNGTVYRGLGSPVGDIQGNGNAATFTAKISGGGILEQI